MSIPDGRRGWGSGLISRHDVLVAPYQGSGGASTRRLFIGAKPDAWTRWVLDVLGYDPNSDTVDDLFPGSHAVGRAVAQNVLPLQSLTESSVKQQ